MDVQEARRITRLTLDEHGLTDWRIKIDRAKTRLGLCNHAHKVISLSGPLTEANSEEVVRNTILHEVAHALVGSRAGHGPVWRAKALELGCNGNRCETNGVSVPRKFVGRCGCPNKVIRRHTRKRGLYCRGCGCDFTWTVAEDAV